MRRKKKIIFLIIIILIILFFYYLNIQKKEKISEEIRQTNQSLELQSDSNVSTNSNVLLDVKYMSYDIKGNKYTITAKRGEIDLSSSNIIFLTDVIAIIELNKKPEIVKITSNFAKYNIDNYDTIFSKNVIIDYLDNKITSEILDFSLVKNLMIISENVIYYNTENIMKADIIEMDISTKDTKIYMYENTNKVNVKSKQ